MPRPQHFTTEQREVNGVKLTLTTYQLDSTWHCTVANVDPGANIARADGLTRDDAINAAMEKVARRVR